MAAPTNVSGKKSNFISNCVTQAQALYNANQALIQLQSEWANQFNTGQSLVLVDADFVGANAYMNAAIFNALFNNVQGAVNTAITNNLQALLGILPQ